MTNINFNYWLQGLFELNERDNNKSLENDITPMLSEGQVACIREHLELVKKTEPLNGFCAWLEGYIDARVGQVGGEIGAQGYMAISERLKQSFQHMSTQQSLMSAIGTGTVQWPGGTGGLGGLGSMLTC